jgi:cobalt-zinc-cadmium efflux system membrane fusion protein
LALDVEVIMRVVGMICGVAVLSAMACARSTETPAAAKTPAATIQHPKPEGELTTVTLTADAVRRLGVETAIATVERVPGTRTLPGEVVVPEGRSVVVSAPVAGTLVSAGSLQAGARVTGGAVIFRLIPLASTERDQRIEAERAVSAAQAENEAATQRLRRLEQLLKDGAASQRSVEEARAQQATAAAALKAAQDRSSAMGRQIGSQGEIAITAPIGGLLQTLTAAPGQTVAAAAPLFTVSQVDTVWIRVPVYAGDATTIDAQQPAAVSTLGEAAAPRIARRITAPPSADPSTASVNVFYELPSGTPPLRPGERVLVQLPLGSGESGLVIPDSATVYDVHGDTWIYQDLGDHRFMRRRIEVARHAGRHVVVSRGLTAGTRVVTSGVAELFGTEFGAGK